jgi:hypothetical protein
MTDFYALRYLDGVPLKDRRHEPTIGRWADFGDADDARATRFNGHLMEVVVRGDSGDEPS